MATFKSFDQSVLLLESRTTCYFWSSWPPFSTQRFCAGQAERSLQRSVCGASELRRKKWLKDRWTGWSGKDRETGIPRMVEKEALPAWKRGQIAALQISFGVMDGKRTALTGWGQPGVNGCSFSLSDRWCLPGQLGSDCSSPSLSQLLKNILPV